MQVSYILTHFIQHAHAFEYQARLKNFDDIFTCCVRQVVGLICTKEFVIVGLSPACLHTAKSQSVFHAGGPVHWSCRSYGKKISRRSGTNSQAVCVYVRVDSAISN